MVRRKIRGRKSAKAEQSLEVSLGKDARRGSHVRFASSGHLQRFRRFFWPRAPNKTKHQSINKYNTIRSHFKLASLILE